MNLTSERVDDVSQGPDRRAGCRLESAEQKGKVEPARRLQLRLEIATLPSYMSSVDLDSFGQLSVFLIECRAKFPHPSKFDRCPRRSVHLGCVATRQFLE
jgi:hypothetical protein